MFMDIINFMFSGFWIFIGSLMLISAIAGGLSAVIKSLLSPWHKHVHYHMNDTEIDMAEFESWKNEKDSQGQL